MTRLDQRNWRTLIELTEFFFLLFITLTWFAMAFLYIYLANTEAIFIEGGEYYDCNKECMGSNNG